MPESTKAPGGLSSLATRLHLGSRFGHRLLLLFAFCAMVPACAVAWLSYRSASRQLTGQSRERLASISGAASKTLFGRLQFLEADLRKAAPRLPGCAECADGLLYAADEVSLLSAKGTLRLLAGEPDQVALPAPQDLTPLEAGASAVLARRIGADTVRLYLVHRREGGSADGHLIARINPGYLWSSADEEALPASVALSLWDPVAGILIAPPSGSAAQVGPAAEQALRRDAEGSFEWRGDRGEVLASWKSPPAKSALALPPWRVILSQPRADVLAPMASFQRNVPLLLAVSLLVVVVLGVTQIRRSLLPLAELQRGTRRIADRDFAHRVQVNSGDELEELAGSFNLMSTRLARQFSALKASAEIDRAVLSSVDAGTIAQAVVDRVPLICPCEGISITLLVERDGADATTWRAGTDGTERRQEPARLEAEDLRLARQHPDRLVYRDGMPPLPSFLAHFKRNGSKCAVDTFPLRYGGEMLGVLALRRKDGETTEDDFVQVRRIADQVAVALSNARMVDQVRFLAFYDSLTRLPNRVLYKERLAQALVRAGRTNRFVAVCFIDLDHFSRINDTLGHDLGDELLREVSSRLVAASRTADSVSRFGAEQGIAEVSRLGGDEFTVVLSDLHDPQESVRVARRLLDTLRKPVKLGTQEVFVTASVGVAIYPFDGSDTEELLKCADVAMYHAKEQGRNTYQMYSASMNAEAMARLQLELQLRKAVEAGEFTIWYQPIVDLDTRKPVAAEALVRWSHPERGLVSPGEFIALCEECGLIVPLGEWILRGVCTQARAWEAAGMGTVRMSVNLSARQLRHDGIVDMVRTILQETGLRPRSLVLELTESMLMEPKGVTGRTIRELADLGVSLAIDDFGTGYSSLSYLKNFPVTALKIDRSFIAGITTDPDDSAITTAIIALADAMELDVVAEGVETEAQAQFLREKGCQKIQGYLVGRPMAREEFEEGLRRASSLQPSAVSRQPRKRLKAEG
jgi:predicted signal transduction protein with EAL and GGDEF domain/HAMP domain-containing protein